MGKKRGEVERIPCQDMGLPGENTKKTKKKNVKKRALNPREKDRDERGLWRTSTQRKETGTSNRGRVTATQLDIKTSAEKGKTWDKNRPSQLGRTAQVGYQLASGVTQ